MKQPMTRDRIAGLLEQDDWFAALPAPLKDAIVSNSCVRGYRTGELVFATGDEPNGLFALLSGQINLVNNSSSGRQVMQNLHRPGTWFGYLSMLDAQPRFQDAAATGPTELLCLGQSAFRRILRADPDYHARFALLLCGSVRVLLGMLVESRTSPLSSRLAATLLDMSGAVSAPAVASPAPRLTQELLAGMVGATRQTVNRQLRDWQARNIIRLGYGAVTVVDRAALAHAARGDATSGDYGRRVA